MSFLKVFSWCFALLVGFVFSGCESTSGGQDIVYLVGEAKTAQVERDWEIKAIDLVERGDGSLDLPPFDLDVVVVLVDTSGSMRDFRTNLMRHDVVARIMAFLAEMPLVGRIELLDTSGNSIWSWNEEGLIAGEGADLKASLGDVSSELSLYRQESVSSPLVGVRKGLGLIRKEAAGLKAAVFVFGDEYRDVDFAEIESLVDRKKVVPIYVIRAHENLVGNFESASRFEKFGSRIAELTGGSYFRIVSSVFSRTPEAMVLGRLVIEHPGETWFIDADAGDVATWNDLLREEFESDRTFLVAKSESEILGEASTFVSLEQAVAGSRRYYVQYRSLDGSEDCEYTVLLGWNGGSYEIAGWELLWEME